MILRSINPYNNQLINEIEEYSDTLIEKIIQESGEAFSNWRKTGVEDRTGLITNVAQVLRERCEEFAVAITTEMGKPIVESRAEVKKCATVCEYYAQNAKMFLTPETTETDADNSYVAYEPLGTILGIMPWNFPFWQVFRFAVPTLMAGNCILLKHSSNVQVTAGKIEEIFLSSGFPEPVFRNLVVGSGRIGQIIEHRNIKAVSLTGSEYAGQKVAELAGRKLKKSLLELGGSNAFIVLSDADLKSAVEVGVGSRFQNAGQSCIAAKRFIIEKRIKEQFTDLFVDLVRRLRTGDPLDEDTDIGPLANVSQAEKVEEQLRISVQSGGRITLGGIRKDAFITPAVVENIRPGMPLFDEEVFGPVAPITIAEDTDEAIALANSTKYGLGVTLFTNDLDKAQGLVPEFQDGAVFINGLVKSDPRLPFGGTGSSGFGRELAIHGIREFVNIKSVWIRKII